MKHVIFTSVCLVLAVTSYSWSASVYITLDDPRDTNPDPYIVDIPQMEINDFSAVEFYVENMVNANRWKNWAITVWIPDDYAPAAQNLDSALYYNEEWDLLAGAAAIAMEKDRPGIDVIPGYKSFTADTREADWFDIGTQPVGGAPWGGDRFEIGNPAWAYLSLDIPDLCPRVFVSLYDECVPEPMTLMLLGLGGLALLRRRKA
jgi:hypothetical protein